MDEYDCIVKSKSLRLKGEKRKKKSSSSSKHHRVNSGDNQEADNQQLDERAEDAEEHGGWWRCTEYEHIKDEVAIEFIPGCYARALSNGSIVLGNPHPPGEGPDEEEIFTAFSASTNQIALKSGFGRYLSVDTRKRLMGLSEAIGEQENFLPVFEDAKLALCAYNECFLSPDESVEEPQPPIVAKADKVGSYELLKIRINNDPIKYSKKSMNKSNEDEEDLGQVYEAELNYLKKYQSNGLKKLIKEDDKNLLKKAKIEGSIHETLLDKRVKLNSDKYCK